MQSTHENAADDAEYYEAKDAPLSAGAGRPLYVGHYPSDGGNQGGDDGDDGGQDHREDGHAWWWSNTGNKSANTMT
ncbi:hypothetical protein C0991_006635, partial [Blastosporella zonata]